MKLFRFVPLIAVFTCIAASNLVSFSLSAADEYFYSGGKKHALIPEPDWLAVEVTDPASYDAVERELKNSKLAASDRSGVRHDKFKILTVRLTDEPGAQGKAREKAAKIKGTKRTARVFKNGKHEPVVETDEFVIRFADDVPRAEIDRLLQARGAEIISPLGNFAPNGFLARVMDPAATPSTDVANALYNEPGVLYSHPNYIWPKVQRFVPNDTIYNQQWHLNNNGANGGVVGADVKAERAWDITRGDPNCLIAILDDGVDLDHEDFASAGKLINHWDFVGNDNNPRPGTGQHHGTSCAGLAAADGNNGKGVSGVAPNCRIMGVRMLGPNHTWDREAAAISHAKNNGAWIISNSWGPEDGTGQSYPCPDVVNNAIVDATDNGRSGKGCIITWAAGNGNESSDLDGYASHPRVICVAATMRNDITSPYSDFGAGVDVCAPGGSSAGDMVTTDRMGSVGYTGTNYTTGFNGTSAATPVVSGVAALLLSAEPTLTWQQVRQRLIDSADFVDTANVTYDEDGHHPWYGFGRVNAWAALTWNDDSAPSIDITVPTNNLVTTVLAAANGTVSDVGVGVLKVEVRLKDRNSNKFWNWGAGFWSSFTETPETYTNANTSGGVWSIALPDLKQGSFELQVRAEDKAGQFSGWVTRIYSLDNAAPLVLFSTPDEGEDYISLPAASGQAGDVGAGVAEVRVALFGRNNGLWWNWTANAWGSATFAFASNVRIATGTNTWSVSLPSLPDGDYQLHAQAVDGLGKASGWAPVSYIIDSASPTIGFSPLTNQATVFDFSGLGGTVSESGTVTYRIIEYNVGGTDRYWNGSAWITNGNDSQTWRPAGVNGLTWYPSGVIPGRGQTRGGHYLIEAKIVDRAEKQAASNLVLIRSAQDTTIPDGSITLPAPGQVFTNNTLPNFYGTAYDGESGIGSITMYLMRATASGFEYWNGRGWSPNAESLAAQINFDSWQAPLIGGTGGYSLPSGSNLRNGNYQLQLSIQNKEDPSGTRGLSVSFVVDYHPVYLWTAGSFTDNDQNNNNHNWDNPENWSPYGVPPQEAIVVINGGDPTATSLGSLNIYGLNITSGSLTYSGLLVRKLNQSGGILAGGALNLEATNGVFNWSGGTMVGDVTFLRGSTVNVSNVVSKELRAATVQNYGTVNWVGTGAIYTDGYYTNNVSRFYNKSNGVFNLVTNGQVFHTAYNASYFYNEAGALFIKTAGGGTNTINSYYFNNFGEVRSDNGAMIFNGEAYSEDGAVYSGTAPLKVEGGRFEIRGRMTLRSNEFHWISGSVVAATNSTLVTTNGGVFDWRGSILYGPMELTANSQMRISGASTKEMAGGARLKNYGTITWSDAGPIYTYGYYLDGLSIIDNMPGASFLVTGNANFTYAYNTSTFHNRAGALFRKTSGNTNTIIDWVFNNDGQLECQSGAIALSHSGVSTGDFKTSSDASIRYTGGTHSWNSVDVEGAGKISIEGGTVNRNGTVQAGATGATLEVRSGALAGTGSLAGSMQVNWLGGTIGGLVNLTPTVTVNASGSDTKTLGGGAVFNNSGTFNWSGPGKLYNFAYNADDRARFNNLSNGVFKLHTDGDLFDITYNVSHFTNHAGGLVVKAGGTGTNAIEDFTFHNFGELRVDTGTLRFTYLVRFDQGTKFTGAGTIRLAADAALDTVLSSTATVVLEAGSLNATTNSAYAGSVPFLWTGGTLTGSFKLETGRIMNLTGSDPKSLSGARFHNHGTLNWTGPGRLYTYAYHPHEVSVFNNYSNAVFNILTDGQVFDTTYNASYFTNHAGGLLAKAGGTGTNSIGFYQIHNYGEIRPTLGTLRFDDVLRCYHGARFAGGGMVRLAGNTAFDGTLTANVGVGLDAGSLTGMVISNRPPTYTGSGLFSWQAGLIAGQFDLATGSTMHWFGSEPKSIQAPSVVNNYGTMSWSGPGRISAAAYNVVGSVLNNYGSFNVLNGGELFDSSYNQSTFSNHVTGRFSKTVGTNTTIINDWLVNNRGEIQAQSGAIDFQYALEIENGSRFTGPGLLHVSAGGAALRGALELDGGATFRMSATLNNELPIMPSVTTRSGTSFEWMGGQFNGTFTVPAGSTMTMGGGTKSFGDGAVFHNRGTINWTAGDLYKSAYNAVGGRLNNESGGEFNILGTGSFTYSYNISTFSNAVGAVVRKSASSATTTCDWIFDNAGSLQLQTGILSLSNPTLRPTATMLFPLAGISATTNFGRLNLPHNATLAGSLAIELTNGFVPVDGNIFSLVSYGSRAGGSEFSAALPALAYPLQWKKTYAANALTFAVERAHVLTPTTTAPQNGQFNLDFSGPSASSAILQTSTNLSIWDSVATNAPFTGTFNFTDFQATVSNKFYRVLINP